MRARFPSDAFPRSRAGSFQRCVPCASIPIFWPACPFVGHFRVSRALVSLSRKRSVMSKLKSVRPLSRLCPPGLASPRRLVVGARVALLVIASHSSPFGCSRKASGGLAGYAVEQVLPLTLGALYAVRPPCLSCPRSPACQAYPPPFDCKPPGLVRSPYREA